MCVASGEPGSTARRHCWQSCEAAPVSGEATGDQGATHNDTACQDESISELRSLRGEPGRHERSPIVADHYTLPIWLQVLLPDANDELGHGFEDLVRAIIWQTVAASISRQVDCDECMRLLQHRGLEDVSP